MLGLKRGTVKLLSHHTEWKKAFEEEKERLQENLGSEIIIEHVGSTAIFGVEAKPILDMMLAFPENENVDVLYNKLVQLGYEDRGKSGVEDRRLFVKGPEEKRTHYLHVTTEDSAFWEEHILFRDYLSKNKKARDEYTKLKIELEKKYSNTRELYTKAKSEFIQEIICKARIQEHEGSVSEVEKK
jgi:GrpB-like predicted nucleotidyltransferase (UPF0157 family)